MWGHLELGKEPTHGTPKGSAPVHTLRRSWQVRGVCKTTPQGVWVGEQQQSQLWSLIQQAGYPGLGPSCARGHPNPLLPPPGAPSPRCCGLLLGGSHLHPPCCAHTSSSRDILSLPLLPSCFLVARTENIPSSWRRWLELAKQHGREIEGKKRHLLVAQYWRGPSSIFFWQWKRCRTNRTSPLPKISEEWVFLENHLCKQSLSGIFYPHKMWLWAPCCSGGTLQSQAVNGNASRTLFWAQS